MPPKVQEKVQWQWWNDRGAWEDYASAVNGDVERVYQSVAKKCSKKATMTFNGWNYEIDFAKNIQKNVSTKRERQIRRFVMTRSGGLTKSKAAASGAAGRALQKGSGVVDPLSNMADDYHVYEGGGDVFQCTLNQANVSSNNNKYYILQLLESDRGGEWHLFTRWGRVGTNGQTQDEMFSNLTGAIHAFKSRFHQKTQNDWDSRSTLTKVPGKYHLMQIDYVGDQDNDSDDDGNTAPKKKAKTDPGSSVTAVKSALPPAVQELMKMIGNKDAMTTAMMELQIDTAKMPLGKISKTQIRQALVVLGTIEKEIKKKKKMSVKNVEQATSEFYTLIPHNFGFKKPPLIDSEDMLREKLEMLEVLSELEIASKLLDSPGTAVTRNKQQHPLDRAYSSLKCELEPLHHSDPEFSRVVEYAKNTHGRTHTSFKLKVLEVFRVKREGEETRYKKYQKKTNKRMLWHGSRTTNFMGILSQGLRIAPPEAPSTGYMFGKGVYLSDVCSKSANYCNLSRANNCGLMLLCEAALGRMKEYHGAHYMLKPEKGYDSTKGVGSMVPDDKGAKVVNGVTWPMGKMANAGSKNTTLLYPEYIVYDEAQVVMRYLVKMSFEF